MALPKANSNPFAIIQLNPSPWKGLVGKTSSGFLIFENPKYGTRAGFINLINPYLERGFDTIEKIFPVYAPAGHGNNNPSSYIELVENISGINRRKKIETRDEIYKLGKAIVQVEEGNFWVDLNEFNEGFELALSNKNFEKTAAIRSGMVIILIIIIGLFTIKNNKPKHNENEN